MANNTIWSKVTSLQTLITTGLDSLANGSAILSAAYDNSTALDLYADFLLAVQYGTAPSAGTKVAELYIECAIDGTNYPSVGSSLPQKSLLVGTFETRSPSTSALEYLVIYGIPLPIYATIKFRIYNTSGQTYKDNTSNKFLKMQPYRLNNNG